MKTLGLRFIALAFLAACVPAAKPDVQDQSTNVTFIGNFSGSSGTTKIYFGKDPNPLATTTNQAHFKIEIPRALIEKASDRRLYFYSSNGETAASEEILSYDMGEKKLGDIELTPPLSMTGTVLATEDGQEKPVADAEITVGHLSATTGADGVYTIEAPRNIELPVLLHKEGFVQTRALWMTAEADETRNFHLFNRFGPIGGLSIPSNARFAATTVPLYLESTPSAAYVRIGTSPFTTAAAEDSSWLDLTKDINLSSETLNQLNLYYQFADKDKQLLGPVQVLNPNPAAKDKD